MTLPTGPGSNRTIKAIETRYRGYRFRSRLEARWAVFFDAARIPYQYEPEGFQLSDGTLYLPDFYLPTVNLRSTKPGKGMYAEVKGAGVTEAEQATLERFVTDKNTNLALLVGEVFNDLVSQPRYEAPGGDGHYQYGVLGEPGHFWWDNNMMFMRCYSCDATKYEFTENNYCICEACGSGADEEHPDLHAAVNAARAARFEHGETPR